MSRRVDLPDHDTVRAAMAEVIRTARDDGRKPTVVALAHEIGLNNSTFWRHFPDLASELVAQARDHTIVEQAQPGRYDQLAAEHARLKRAHAELQHDHDRAKAVIQRLSLDNHRLRQQIEGAAKIIPIHQKRKQGSQDEH
ncbi:hypothetical protein GCM10027184_55780 [Saccharothrix stipae]